MPSPAASASATSHEDHNEHDMNTDYETATVKLAHQKAGFAIFVNDAGDEFYCHPRVAAVAGLNLHQGDKVRFKHRPDSRGGSLPFVTSLEAA